MIALNRIVPYEKVFGSEEALSELKKIESTTQINEHYLFFAIKSDLLKGLGKPGGAKECLEKTTNDLDKSIKLMADSIKQFHHLYISKVVRENNLLHDLLTHCFDKVQWDKVAKHFFNKAS